jgi:acetyl-CoA C-acetyltransferase
VDADRSNWPLIAGSAISAFARAKDGSTWRDRARAVAAAAVEDAGLGMRDIDALVVATESDIASLQVNAASVVASDLGLAGVAAMRVEGGGASGGLALRAGVLHVLSGLHRRVLVVGFDDTASHLDRAGIGLVYGLSFDAEVEGFAGVSAAAVYALSIREHMARYGTTEAELAAVAVKNRGHAALNPLAHLPRPVTVADVLASPAVSTPYKRLDCSPLSDAAAALVLARACDLPGRSGPSARIVASAAASDHARLGDRAERHRLAAKARSAAAAFAMAGITDPPREIAVAEVYDAFTGAELQALEALGLSREGQAAAMVAAGAFARGGTLPVNLSGGLLGQGSAPGATGIAQAATIARLVTGTYFDGLQPDPAPHRGLADTHGGIATIAVTHIIAREEG